MTSAKGAVAPRRQLEPTHACIRCGREGVPMDAGLCELCNPLELSQPSATQMHGIAAVGIIAFIVVLAVAGRVAIAGTGPFQGQVSAIVPAPAGLAVTILVTNGGAKDAATTCAVTQSPTQNGPIVEVVQTPLIQAGTTLEYTAVVTKFGTQVVSLTVQCASP
jgi:hypothetical protein